MKKGWPIRNREVRFPPFRLDATDERLYRGEQAIELRPKTFAVLRHLLTNAGQLVTKHDLLEAIWPGVSVTDTVLKGCIAEIRAALQDDPAAPQFVETAHRRGYRFIGRIASGDSAAPAAAPAVVFGREDDLARMHGWFADALAGRRQLVFVTGEPGIGKTTLVDVFTHQAGRLHSPWIARGQCGRGQVDEAHRVLSEVYARFTEGHDSPDLAQARAVVAASI